LEGFGKLKENPMTSSGIEHVTFWLVAQRLDHYATACPRKTEDTTETELQHV
jgi:hypothetical protein